MGKCDFDIFHQPPRKVFRVGGAFKNSQVAEPASCPAPSSFRVFASGGAPLERREPGTLFPEWELAMENYEILLEKTCTKTH
jgi:hypothetical protein